MSLDPESPSSAVPADGASWLLHCVYIDTPELPRPYDTAPFKILIPGSLDLQGSWTHFQSCILALP